MAARRPPLGRRATNVYPRRDRGASEQRLWLCCIREDNRKAAAPPLLQQTAHRSNAAAPPLQRAGLRTRGSVEEAER